jgi:FSR family fosmidomycin resistance protein-like MFS transporter
MFVVGLLLVELLDELVYGTREASWPLIQHDFGLRYATVGLLLGIPTLFAGLVEPVIGLVADTGHRRVLILGGGIAFGAALLTFGLSPAFLPLLAAATIMYPASGAFVSLSQTALMDAAPSQREHNMVRWTIAGALGAFVGPLLLAGLLRIDLTWRVAFAGFGLLTGPLVLLCRRYLPREDARLDAPSFRAVLHDATRSVRREALGWLVLLLASDLLQDVYLGFLALYLVNVEHVAPSLAALGVTVWVGAHLVGNVVLLRLLHRVSGLRYVWLSSIGTLGLFPLFLLVPALPVKAALIALLGFTVSGWYPVLQARLYGSLPERSGTAMALGGLLSPLEASIPLTIGLLAQAFGLGIALWFLLLGPLALALALPFSYAERTEFNS